MGISLRKYSTIRKTYKCSIKSCETWPTKETVEIFNSTKVYFYINSLRWTSLTVTQFVPPHSSPIYILVSNFSFEKYLNLRFLGGGLL